MRNDAATRIRFALSQRRWIGRSEHDAGAQPKAKFCDAPEAHFVLATLPGVAFHLISQHRLEVEMADEPDNGNAEGDDEH